MNERVRASLRSVLFTGLAILTAMVFGALVIIFSDTETLNAWGDFFQDPLGALEASWEVGAVGEARSFATALASCLPSSTPH